MPMENINSQEDRDGQYEMSKSFSRTKDTGSNNKFHLGLNQQSDQGMGYDTIDVLDNVNNVCLPNAIWDYFA